MADAQLYSDLTRKIIGCAFEVSNELGSGFLESVYEAALKLALTDSGIAVETQKPVEVVFRGQTVGRFYADLLVDEKVIVELKAVQAIAPEHQAQIINYLNATGVQVGWPDQLWQPEAGVQTFHTPTET